MSMSPMWGLAMGGRESEVGTLEGLSKDMQALFLSDSGDIVVKCENKQIKVHSFLIGARSPVFARMFQTGMKEQQDRVVELKDDTYDDIRRLLFYMYTGLFEDILDVLTLDHYVKIKRLLIVADKYEVLKLAFYIGSEIALNEENAVELRRLRRCVSLQYPCQKMCRIHTQQYGGLSQPGGFDAENSGEPQVDVRNH